MGTQKQGNSTNKGRQGEAIVLAYLKKCGWRILEQNYRIKQGEIDLIAMDHNELVFIEVKSGIYDTSDLAKRVDKIKRKRMEQIALIYQHQHHLEQYPIRLDIVTVSSLDGRIQHFSHEFFDD